MDYEAIERQEFEISGKKYIYDLNLIDIEQAELAREISEWKETQLATGTDDLSALITSKGAQAATITFSILIREETDKGILPFDVNKALNIIEPSVRKLSYTERERVRKCITDFFTATGTPSMALPLLSGKRKQSPMELLWPLMMKANIGENRKNSSSAS